MGSMYAVVDEMENGAQESAATCMDMDESLCGVSSCLVSDLIPSHLIPCNSILSPLILSLCLI